MKREVVSLSVELLQAPVPAMVVKGTDEQRKVAIQLAKSILSKTGA